MYAGGHPSLASASCVTVASDTAPLHGSRHTKATSMKALIDTLFQFLFIPAVLVTALYLVCYLTGWHISMR